MHDHQPPRILLIDNDESMLAAVSTRLEFHGYQCVTACSGAQGISVFSGKPTDLVITDINMPGGDGLTVVRELRKLSEVPIIVCTGFRDHYWDEIHCLPNVSVVRKPCETSHLMELVETELVLAGVELPANEAA